MRVYSVINPLPSGETCPLFNKMDIKDVCLDRHVFCKVLTGILMKLH